MSVFQPLLDWVLLTTKLNQKASVPNFSVREVWNCYWGINIGFEINGKTKEFTRPVLILKKLSRYTFVGIPLTSKLHDGPGFLPSKVNGREGRFVLNQIRVLDARRLINRKERVHYATYLGVQDALKTFLG